MRAMTMEYLAAEGIFMETRLGIKINQERSFSKSRDIIDQSN